MDWANERYVRVFTRDTVGTLCLSWEARCLFWELLRKVDRAGVLDCGGHDPAKALAVSLRIPLDVAARVLPEWETDGRAIVRDGAIVIPCHLAAQEATQSDRARARAARERRSIGVTNCDATVTGRDAAVTNCDETVTPSHVRSRAVTRGHSSQTSQTSQTDPDQRERAPAAPARAPRKRKSGAGEGTTRPDDWAPNERARAVAREWNLDLTLELADFCAWTDAKQWRFANWDAGFMSHMTKAHKRNCERDGDRRARYEAADHAERKAHPIPVLPELIRREQPEQTSMLAESFKRRMAAERAVEAAKGKVDASTRLPESDSDRDSRIEAERQRQRQALAAMDVAEVAS